MRKVFALAVVLLAACSSQQSSSRSPAAAATTKHVVSSTDNGRSIFTTGRDSQGARVTSVPPPMRTSCIQCHGATGAGGVKFPDGAVSADLRHKALVTDQKPPYTVALLERAISTGTDNQGRKLDPVMPRWHMNARDLHDIALYVYTQIK